VFAIANRCPHEGYPLSEGTLGPDCVLTSNWQNWKFDLANSEALIGRDLVRIDPVAERNGEILIEPPGHIASDTEAQANSPMPRRGRGATNHPTVRSA